ncbi:hypothetical protein [Allorhizobium undicola]|uniref:hypothetical protein n=1 Tax=Allorhizobium undicola TaxID=78527 RepID=UPI000A7B6574|nr:hypothetical protein [Allorhizobium undicola]
MTKAVAAFLILAMAAHHIRPFGLPGLQARRDFWRLALVAFVIWTLDLLLRP